MVISRAVDVSASGGSSVVGQLICTLPATCTTCTPSSPGRPPVPVRGSTRGTVRARGSTRKVGTVRERAITTHTGPSVRAFWPRSQSRDTVNAAARNRPSRKTQKFEGRYLAKGVRHGPVLCAKILEK